MECDLRSSRRDRESRRHSLFAFHLRRPLKGAWRAVWSILFFGALTSCAGLDGYPKNPDSSATLVALQKKYFGANADDSYNILKPQDANYAALRQQARDDIVYSRMQAYDIEFSEFQRALSGFGNVISVGSDLTALILNGLGATTGTASTKAALSAASGGVIGAQGVINKDLYYQKTLPAIIAQMEANRARVKLAIFTGLKQPDAQYSLKRAESDLADLNDAGSLPNAINNITQQSTDQKNTTQMQIQATQTLTFSSTDSATTLQAWLYSAGKVDLTHFKALQDWLNKQPEDFLNGKDYPPAAFVSGDTSKGDLEAIRQRALKDPMLNIPK